MVQVQAVTKPSGKVQAYIVGVDKDRRAPGLKLLGLEKESIVAELLANKAVPLPFKTVRALPVPRGWVVLVGMGDPKKLTQERLGTLANLGSRAAGNLGCAIAVTTLVTDTWKDDVAAQAVTHGAIIGGLDFDQWKSKKEERKEEAEGEKKPTQKVDLLEVLVPGASLAKAVERAAVAAEAVNDSRLLSNTPANICTPGWLAKQALERGRTHGFKVTTMGRKELREGGYGALCGVAQGSVNEEQLIVMDYTPPGWKAPARGTDGKGSSVKAGNPAKTGGAAKSGSAAKSGKAAKAGAKGGKTLVVVGKGVCFDSGGISLKPGDKMWEMKYDKIGACNTLALMTTLKRLGVKHRVVGIVPAVENLPSGTAQRPGDIVTAKDGTTIEVLNTDAEGRLILADAIAHAHQYQPTWIVDMATLTGACDVAVGPTYVALMSNDDRFAAKLRQDSLDAGDKAWHLPQGDEYDDANKGTYADLQNISLTNRAGTCIGGSFLKHFAKDTTWAHLDIASKAWTAGADYYAKGPTGAGLRIVLQRILRE